MPSGGSRLRVGIAGFGVMGQRRRRWIDQHPGMIVVAVADPAGSPELLSDVRSTRPELLSDVHDLLDQPLDAVFVCVPCGAAAEVTIAALERGLHVFCEKPPGRTADEVRAVRVAEAASANLKLMYGFNHRYHGSVAQALEIVRSGELGRVRTLRGVYGKAGGTGAGWRACREKAGGGILLDQGIHMVDLLRRFAGEEFVDVAAFVQSDTLGWEVEDNAMALLRTPGGTTALLHSSATEWRHRFRLEIGLGGGALELNGILSGTMRYAPETLTVLRRGSAEAPVTHEYSVDDSWGAEIAEFEAAIRERRPPSGGTSSEALEAMALIDRIYAAASTPGERIPR